MTSTPNPVASRLEHDLDVQIAGLRREVRWLTILGLALVISLASYFSYVVGIIHREMRPRDLAKVTAAYTSEFLLTALKTYSDDLIRRAPGFASQALDYVLGQSMALVRDSRYLVIGWIEERLTDVEQLMVRITDRAYDEHLPDLKLLVANIKTPDGRKAFEEYFTTLLSSPLASESVRIDIESLDLTLQAMRTHLNRLVKGEGLTPEERAERDLLLSSRAFWERFRAR